MSFLFRFHDLIGGIHIPIDDGIDKLNRKYTLLVFLFLALPIFTKQYIGDPIECFTPTYFTEPQARFVNSYCWTASTYYLVAEEGDQESGDSSPSPLDPRLMPDEIDYASVDETQVGSDKLRRVHVSYYQWAPLILLMQGCCFHLPFVLWGAWAHNAGVKLRRLLKRASDIASLPPGCQQRESLLAEFVDQFHTLVTGNASCCADPTCRIPVVCRCTGGPSRYLCLLYLMVKTLYVLNVFFQFLLLTAFMGRGFLRHGVELLRRLAIDGDWWNSPRFPLQTLCQVRAAIQGGLRTYICRCVLPINVFNEKIFSVIWFYMAFLLPVNFISLFLWVWRCFPCNRLAFIRLILWRTRLISMADISRISRKISDNYLGWDGVFVLRMIEHNHGSAMATIIIGKLWEFYANQMKAQDEASSDVERGSVASVAPSTSWHSCHANTCHLSHFGQQQTLPSTKRAPPNGYWGGKCS
ncbi:innexin unc-9-like [Centruroides sculpturatus]|uniref:innexin unc-9-like n=1 Tax=Centruroides sculpturatus TaxID=218467 RepID=UPI000C6E76B2|nr:innexin unc-9-like [Centruroides sculpturatus]XP_023229450.1 innexin unc-9-like [Centruroides sculpturatus]